MCQVHTGAYVSLLAPGKTDYTACHPGKTTRYQVYITRSTHHYEYARQTRVNWKKENKYLVKYNNKIKERKGKKRKGNKAKNCSSITRIPPGSSSR